MLSRSSSDPSDPPAPPAVAADLFGSRLEVAVRYASLLAGTGIDHGLIGPRERPRLWERHILNCAVIAPGFAPDADLLDIGSGAGLPGIVLAIARPDLRVTLVEPLHRRVRWLDSTIRELGLANVSPVVGRAESLWGRTRSRYVTARAVAPLGVLASWSLPLLQTRGSMLVIKGERAEAELEADRRDIARCGGRLMRVERYGAGVIDPPTVAVRIEVDELVEPAHGNTRSPRRASRRTAPRRGRPDAGHPGAL